MVILSFKSLAVGKVKVFLPLWVTLKCVFGYANANLVTISDIWAISVCVLFRNLRLTGVL